MLINKLTRGSKMTVEEAKTKVCPFIHNGTTTISKGIIDAEVTVNMIGAQLIGNIYCICGDCIAWKFTVTHEQIKNDEIDNISSYEKPFTPYFTKGNELPYHKKQGYCARIGQ